MKKNLQKLRKKKSVAINPLDDDDTTNYVKLSAAYVIFEPRGREKKKQQNETTVSKVDLFGFYQM